MSSEARPRRGVPAETRDRLVATAAEVFNRDGYDGTDSNRIAREAGYSPGTFYKHFPDKKAIFLAVYEEWVAREWQSVGALLTSEGSVQEVAGRIVDVFLDHHARWRGFRASLRALVPIDADVRAFSRELRKKQLEALAHLSKTTRGGRTARSREEDALLLFSVERAADAVADGEAESLGLRARPFREALIALLVRRMEPPA